MSLEIFTKNASELIEQLGVPSARLPGGWGVNATAPVDKEFFAADVRKTVEGLVAAQGDIKGMFDRVGLVQVGSESIPARVADSLRKKLREEVESVKKADEDRRQSFGKLTHRVLYDGMPPSAAYAALVVDVKPAVAPTRDAVPRESLVGDFPRYAPAGLPDVKAEAAKKDKDKYSLPKSYGLGLYLAAAAVAAAGTFMLLFFVK